MERFGNQRGGAALVAIMVMLIAGILLLAFLPNAVDMLKLTKIGASQSEARFSAEAGAKRAISALNREDTAWSWLGRPQQLVAGDDSKTYVVKITPELVEGIAPKPETVYTVSAEGYTKDGGKKTVMVDVTMPTKESDDDLEKTSFRFMTFSRGATDITNSTVHGDMMSSGAIRVYNVLNFDRSKLYAPDHGLIADQTFDQSFRDLKKEWATKYELNGLKNVAWKDWSKEGERNDYSGDFLETFSPGNYEVNGDLSVGNGTKLCLNKAGDAIIHVKGNLNVHDHGEIGTLMLQKRNILLLVDGTVNVRNFAALNHVAVVSGGSMAFYNGAALWGTMQSSGALRVDQSILHYDKGVAKAFVRQAAEINNISGGVSEGGKEGGFEVGAWR